MGRLKNSYQLLNLPHAGLSALHCFGALAKAFEEVE